MAVEQAPIRSRAHPATTRGTRLTCNVSTHPRVYERCWLLPGQEKRRPCSLTDKAAGPVPLVVVKSRQFHKVTTPVPHSNSKHNHTPSPLLVCVGGRGATIRVPCLTLALPACVDGQEYVYWVEAGERPDQPWRLWWVGGGADTV